MNAEYGMPAGSETAETGLYPVEIGVVGTEAAGLGISGDGADGMNGPGAGVPGMEAAGLDDAGTDTGCITGWAEAALEYSGLYFAEICF